MPVVIGVAEVGGVRVNIRLAVAATGIVLLLTVAAACDRSEGALPQFVTVPVHDPAAIERISRFRSGVGHDFSDGLESCRSMKHYFAPPNAADWSELEIRAPFDGQVVSVESEWAGDKVELVAGAPVRIGPGTGEATESAAESAGAPPARAEDFLVTIFHVVLDSGMEVGRVVSAGERLGRHFGWQTMSDVAVWYVPSGESRRLVSYFDILDERAFEEYRAAGMSSREGMLIGKAERDAVPLVCGVDGRFVEGEGPADWGRPEDWVRLSR